MARTGAILLRVSQAKQATEDKSSYAVQLRDCLAYAAQHDIHVPEELIWSEIGSRGNYHTRDGLQAALEAAQEDKYEALIVWRIDRLTDQTERFLTITRMLREHNAYVWSATEPDVDVTTDGGRDNATLKVIFQIKPERIAIRTRTHENRVEYTRQGRPWASHRARYGYRWIIDMSYGHTVRRYGMDVPLKEKLEPDPETGPVMQQMYDWADAGKTLKWIAHALSRLEEGGIYKKPTPRQYQGMGGANEIGEWDEGSITRMLEFPGYMGRWPAERETMQERTTVTERERKRQAPQPEDKWIWVEPSPVTLPLVTLDQWRRVQQRLADNKRYSQRNRKTPIGAELALLHTGMARCGLCGGPIDARPRAHSEDYPDGTRRYQYQCRAARKLYPACVGVYGLAEPIDRSVQLALADALSQPDAIRRLAQRSLDHDQAEAGNLAVITPMTEYDALAKKLTAKEREAASAAMRANALRDADPEDMALVSYDLRMRTLGAEVKGLRDEVEQAKRRVEKYQRVEKTIDEWEHYLAAWEDNVWSLGNPINLSRPEMRQRYRQLLEVLGARVIIHKHGADGPIATLRLHLSQLDFAAKPIAQADVPLDVPVVPAGGERRAFDLALGRSI